jgi:hypothetical protein
MLGFAHGDMVYGRFSSFSCAEGAAGRLALVGSGDRFHHSDSATYQGAIRHPGHDRHNGTGLAGYRKHKPARTNSTKQGTENAIKNDLFKVLPGSNSCDRRLFILTRLTAAEMFSRAPRTRFQHVADVVGGHAAIKHILLQCGDDFCPANLLPGARDNGDDRAQQAAYYGHEND